MNPHGQRVLYWGRVWAQESMTGGWTWARVRPRWYWFLSRLWLFVYIVWEWYGSLDFDWRMAWMLSDGAVGLSRVPLAIGRPGEARIYLDFQDGFRQRVRVQRASTEEPAVWVFTETSDGCESSPYLTRHGARRMIAALRAFVREGDSTGG